jgi:hypothetical protein
MNWIASDLLLSLLVVPILAAIVDIIPAARATRGRVFPLPENGYSVDDFTILVPIYGSVKYLENVDYLSTYGSKVVLVTTDSESGEFNRTLDAIAAEHGFNVYRARVKRNVIQRGGRSTGGTVRDRIIREASECMVTTEYVVCIDADTVTTSPVNEIVGALEANDLDLASVRLVPLNTSRVLGKLQAHEYRMVMRLRRILPWVCSGAFHLARHDAHREIMKRHSLFFQGNDVELGILGDEMGYKVGHLMFDVPTTVPDGPTSWLRQRVAWSGGEFRLFIANPQIAIRHPFYFFYGAVVVILLAPFRWISVYHLGWDMASVFIIYWTILVLVNWRHKDWTLLLYPLYGMFNSLVLVPLGLFSYLWMAIPEGNWGWIRLSVHRTRHRVAVRPSSPPALAAPRSGDPRSAH